MENNTRQPFKKYKELRVYFGITQYAVIQYNCEGMEFAKAFDWFKFSSRGATFKDTNSGMTIHFKYSSVDGIDDNNSRALIFEDVELYTPFIKTEDGVIKFITWEEWNEKYNTEAICKRITSVTDEHLKEHGTELMYILDKLCTCAAHPNFDHPHRFIKVEPRYQDNEYSLHRVAADFKWHYGAKTYDYIRYLFEYTAKNRTIHIDISKHATLNMPSPIFSSPFLANTVPDDFKADTYSIDVEFNKDYSISNVTVKNKNKENLLKFMEMGNPVIKNTIRQIRDYINAKLEEKQLTSRINVTNEQNMYVQTWTISSRCDVPTKKKQKPTSEDIRKAMERGKAYDIEHTYFSTVVKYLFDEFGLTTPPSNIITGTYMGDASNVNENIYVSINKEARTVSLSVSDRLDGKIVVKMGFDNADEFIDTVDVESTYKDYYDLSNSISSKTRTTLCGLRTLLKSATSTQFTFGVLDDHPFRLNLNGDIYTQIKNECEWIFNHPKETQTYDPARTSTCSGYILYLSSGVFEEGNRERIRFEFDTFATFHRITIEILDPNREKLKVTLGIEDSQLVSIGVNPGFDNFEKVIDRIYNPRVKRLVSEIFNKLYKGEE